jgi:hypothetical protein
MTLDPFSAEAALRKGEIDWWENPSRDLVDRVADDLNITVVPPFATANGIMTFNQLHPPFNNRRSGARCSARSTRPRRSPIGRVTFAWAEATDRSAIPRYQEARSWFALTRRADDVADIRGTSATYDRADCEF